MSSSIFKAGQIWVDVLTALDGVWCHLQRHRSPRGLVDVNPEHHPHTRVLASDVGLPLPQLYVRVTQLQDSRAVDSVFAKTQDKESAGSVYDICNLTLNQDLCSKDFHSGLHHCSPEEGCQQKINSPTPSRAFTPQWTCSGVKLKLYRKKRLEAFNFSWICLIHMSRLLKYCCPCTNLTTRNWL